MKKEKERFEFCVVCKLNQNQGRKHNFLPNHRKSLSSFLSRFQSKLSDVRFFLKNPSLLRPEHSSRNRLWCVFCDSDLDEVGSSFACANAISHLASASHLKKLKGFLWKYGAGMDRVDSFRISEDDLSKWEKKCKSLKTEVAGEGSHGLTIGPLNDIHNELKSEYVDTSDKNNIQSLNSSFSYGVVPLQNHTTERYQVSDFHVSRDTEVGSYPQLSAGHHIDASSWHSSSVTGCQDFQHPTTSYSKECPAAGYGKNGVVYQGTRGDNGDNNYQAIKGVHNLTPVSSKIHRETSGNVHSGAPPPWLDVVEGTQLDNRLKPGLGTNKTIPSVGNSGKSSKLNPKRVGAAWAERRKIELEMEKRGEIASNTFDANWLPNFGRVWQSGSRKESMKEFEVESRKHRNTESQSETIQFQPYISKRMVALNGHVSIPLVLNEDNLTERRDGSEQ